MLLSDFALVPDVFDPSYYSTPSPDLAQACLDFMRAPLLSVALVRDLRNGEWSQYCADNAAKWHPRAGELLRKLALQNRLYHAPSAGRTAPVNPEDWCLEAVESNARFPLTGIITSHSSKQKKEHAADPTVASVEKVGVTAWWCGGPCSSRPRRCTADYLANLDKVLKQANSLIFIDPHLDPSRHSYREFLSLMEPVASRRVRPLIELHRVCYEGSGRHRCILEEGDIKTRFSKLGNELGKLGISAEVFVWDDFHDRYLITDLFGIKLSDGFDISGNAPITTWAIISRTDRDDVQREFEANVGSHKLRLRFRIGC